MLVYFAYLLIFLLVGSAAYAGFTAAPWVPTRRNERKAVLEHLTLQKGQIVYDLGSGTGIMLFELAKRYPQAEYRGLEISIIPLLYALGKKYLFYQRYKMVHFSYKNIYHADISQADVVFVFLLERAYKKLLPVLQKSKPDTVIILEGWGLQGVIPRDILKENKALPFHVYEGIQLKQQP